MQSSSIEMLKFLIEQKISVMNTLAQVCMIWWVSGTAFCGSILAWIWTKRKELKHAQYLTVLGSVLFVFFLTILGFGGLLVWYTVQLETELGTTLSQLPAGNNWPTFMLEVTVFRYGMLIGSSSFILLLIVWLFMWRRLHNTRTRRRRTPTQAVNTPNMEVAAPAT